VSTRIDVLSSDCIVRADTDRLAQVKINLLSCCGRGPGRVCSRTRKWLTVYLRTCVIVITESEHVCLKWLRILP